MKNYEVTIETDGPNGNIIYQEGAASVRFFWEFGATKVLAMVDIGTPEEWETKTHFPLSRRDQIVSRMADEIIKQKASGCTHTIVKNWLYFEEP